MTAPKCLLLEIEGEEAERIARRIGDACELVHTPDTLQEVDPELLGGVSILSPFIHSRVDEGNLAGLPDLRLVATRSTGVDHIDLAACRDRDVYVCHVPVYGANTVAEHTFGLLLALTRKVHKAYEQTVRGRFDIHGLRGVDLRDRTLGVVGTGAIGAHVIRIALGFQMQVLAYDVDPAGPMAAALGFEYVDLDSLLRRSDVVSLHAPHVPATQHMIDRDAIARMKPGAILINTSRGALVDTDALVEGLRSNKLGGAGLDVLEEEQAIMEEGEMFSSRFDDEVLRKVMGNTLLLRMDNVIITPHIGFNSEEAAHKILDTTADNILAFLEGRTENAV